MQYCLQAARSGWKCVLSSEQSTGQISTSSAIWLFLSKIFKKLSQFFELSSCLYKYVFPDPFAPSTLILGISLVKLPNCKTDFVANKLE